MEEFIMVILKSLIFFSASKTFFIFSGGRNEDGLAHVVVMKSMRYDCFFCLHVKMEIVGCIY